MTMNKILLFADDDTAKRYTAPLATIQVDVISIKPLSFQQISSGIEELSSALESKVHDAIVITSSRASTAISSILEIKHDIQLPQKIYAVGNSTAEALPINLRSQCIGLNTGNASSLADLIISETPKSVLFPCGDLALNILSKKLTNAGIPIKRIEVYATRQNPELENELAKLFSNNSLPSTMIFFSPSGVDYVLKILKSFNCNISMIKLIAIGMSTNARIVEHGFEVWATAAEPTPKGVFDIFNDKKDN